MSGRKQHFIPKVLLRGFAREIRGSERVWVNHRERGAFESNVLDVAASRDFYSAPAGDAVSLTLDDRITDYENQLAESLGRLRTAPEGPVDTDLATEVVSHLFFRTEAIRDLTGEAMLMVQRLKAWLSTPEAMLTFIGADGPKPGKRFDDFINVMREDPRWPAMFGGVSLRRVRAVLFQAVRRDPQRIAGGFMDEAASELMFLLREHRALARDAHADALGEDVSVRPPADRFAGLDWSVVDYDEALPLPDTVVLASADGLNFSSLPWVDRPSRRHVIMPLSSGRLLQGQSEGPMRYPPSLLAQALIEGASAFVVSRTSLADLDPATIGKSGRAAMDAAVAGAVSDVFSRPLRRSASRGSGFPVRGGI